MRTNVPGVYAIGDVVPGHMLAHVASYEGECAMDNILGHERAADYRAVPDWIFTIPEIASVGMTEAEAKEQGIPVRVTKFPFAALGRAQAIGEPHGLVKLVCSGEDGTILGMQILGAHASDVIAEGTLAVQQRRHGRRPGPHHARPPDHAGSGAGNGHRPDLRHAAACEYAHARLGAVHHAGAPHRAPCALSRLARYL